MANEAVLIGYFLMWYCLVGLALLYILSGIDDLFFDIYYWVRCLFRVWKTRHYEPLTYEALSVKTEQMIAVLIPCWHEAQVIERMLNHNLLSIDYKHYYFFVGLYPNDPETIAEVQGVAQSNAHVQCVIGEVPGPTNKAANLNTIYQAIKAFEITQGIQFSMFVFHDSEDVIHPLSFKLYNFLIPRKDMIQIPIFPLEVSHRNFTHWLYADEFAENHTKDIIVRESIQAHVPSAGVGTAFSRSALDMLEHQETKVPFSTDSLTEDYRTSLALRVHNLKQVFVTQHVIRMQWKKRWFSGYVQKPVKERVAVRALFPLTYMKAVRQKARWIIGIVFQEWQFSHWPKGWRIRYTLAHDRKSFITHFINGFGYILFTGWLLYSLLTRNNPVYPSLQERFNAQPWVWWLIMIATVMMCQRLIQRTIATYRIYGGIPAMLVLPRALFGNVLNLHALIRAYRVYFRAQQQQSVPAASIVWDKTEHAFPGRHILVPYRKRLGDLLLQHALITDDQLYEAMIQQQQKGERLGQVLCRLGYITNNQLVQVLSSQYQLPLYPKTQLDDAMQECGAMLPKKIKAFLLKQGVNAVQLDRSQNIITIVIDDPTNELLLNKIMNYLFPYQIRFMLLDAEPV